MILECYCHMHCRIVMVTSTLLFRNIDNPHEKSKEDTKKAIPGSTEWLCWCMHFIEWKQYNCQQKMKVWYNIIKGGNI